MNILLVEDSATQAALTINDLKQVSNKIAVEHVSSAKAALQPALLGKFDLVILDVTLPDGSGVEICRTLKSNASTRAVPVVLFSAESLTNLRKEAYEAGAEYCITKGTTGGMSLNLLVSTIYRRLARSVA